MVVFFFLWWSELSHTSIHWTLLMSIAMFSHIVIEDRSAAAQSLEHTISGQEVVGSIPAPVATRSLLVESVSV